MAKRPLSSDPTRTRTLRDKAVRNNRVKYGEIKRLITESIVDNKVFSTNAQPLTTDEFLFKRESRKVLLFDKWLQGVIDEIIIVIPSVGPTLAELEAHWYVNYIAQGYKRGAISGNNDISAILGRNQVPEITASYLNLPTHLRAAELLFTRTFNQLKGITQQMSAQISRELTKGLLEGVSPRELAKRLNDRVDKIGISRSNLLSRTEIINSRNTASILEGERLGDLLGEKVFYEWITSRDDRVRNTHISRDRKIYTEGRVFSLIGEPNCRCATKNVIESRIDDDIIILGKE